AEFARRLTAGAVIAAIVRVAAVGDGGKAARAGDRGELRVQLVLAVIAAVRGIRAVLRAIDFRGPDEFVLQVERTRDADRQIAMPLGIARTVGGDAEGARPEDAGRGDGYERAVHAAAVGHDHRPETGEPRVEGGCLACEMGGGVRRGRRRRYVHSSQSSVSVSSS